MTPRPSPIRVLVVDDDEMSRELLIVLLEGEGYEVTSADSGEAALVLLGGPRSTPDVVLTDMQLPGISGADLARELRNACGTSTQLLAISGSQPTVGALSLFDGFLLKPFPMEDVAAALRAREIKVTAVSAPPATNSRKKPANIPQSASARRPGTSAVTLGLASVAAPGPQTASKKVMNAVTQARVVPEDASGSIDVFPVLNETIFQQLAKTMPGPQLQEMYMLCVGDARRRIEGMRTLAAEHDTARFVREAHAIKGGSGMLGATELHRKAAELESHGLGEGPQGGTQDVNSLDELSAACDRLERMLGARL